MNNAFCKSLDGAFGRNTVNWGDKSVSELSVYFVKNKVLLLP